MTTAQSRGDFSARLSRPIALGILAVSACAQTAPSPQDLAHAIDSHKADWASISKALGVTDLSVLPRCDPSTIWPCSVDVITVFKPAQVILALSGWPESSYLRFLENGSRWLYVGTQGAMVKNYGGRYEISRVAENPFLRISSQGANGSDIDSEIETWFDLTLSDFEPVFGFTVQGTEHRMGIGVSREVRATATYGGEIPAETIHLDLEIRYLLGYGADLGFARYRATYQRAANEKKFSLRDVHPLLSDAPSISNKDFQDLANIDGATINESPSNERLLVYALPRLKQIASGADAETREWLRSVLSFCKDTPEKRMLLELLAKP
jgi:hypothetical protein